MSCVLLLRAYFDLNGNFDDISQAPFYEMVAEQAKSLSLDIKEFCYREIGYSSDKGYSAENRYLIRASAVDSSNPEALRLCAKKENLPVYLKEHDLEPYFVKENITRHKYADIIVMVSNYIENTDLLAFTPKKGEGAVMLREMFLPLKLAENKTKLEEKIMEFVPVVTYLLETAVVSKKSEYSYASAGKLVLNEKVNAPKLAIELCRHIGRRSQFMSAKHYYHVMKLLPCYQFSGSKDTTLYQSVVDVSNIYGMTVAELIQYMGFQYVNQFVIYEKTGYFIFRNGEDSYKLINPFDEQEQKELTSCDFRRFFEEGQQK